MFIGEATALVLALLGALHVLWAARGVAAGSSVIPERDGMPLFRPGRVATLAVAAALLVASAVVLGQTGRWAAGVPRIFFRVATYGVAAVFLARALGDFRYLGFFKRVRGTRFAKWDSAVFSPLALAIAAGCAAVAWGGGR